MSQFSAAKPVLLGEVSTCVFYACDFCPLLRAIEAILVVHGFSPFDAFHHPVSLEHKKMLPCPFYLWKISDMGKLNGYPSIHKDHSRAELTFRQAVSPYPDHSTILPQSCLPGPTAYHTTEGYWLVSKCEVHRCSLKLQGNVMDCNQ